MGAMISAVLIASLGDRLPRGLLMLGGVTQYGLSVVAFAIVGLAHVTSWALVQTVIQNYSPSLPGFARTTLTPGRTVKNVAGSWATNADLSRTGWSRTG